MTPVRSSTPFCPSSKTIPASAPFATRLLAWWDVHGRKDLPWQHPRTPYRVWVSEVMLQQTQVTTVIPYFERWMQHFPDVQSLAAAEQDKVLSHWSGLGYYARARNLHKTAQVIAAEFDGELPTDPAQLNELPGIGESTANAIVSQAHDVPLAILDGNAKRVLARHAAVAGWPGQSNVIKALWQQAEQRLPRIEPNSRGADYTQAIMDLGATLCTRSKPTCLTCPVQEDCQARLEGTVEQYPGRKPKKSVPSSELHWLLVSKGDSVLLERRPPSGIWGGLWCPPQAESVGELSDRFNLEHESLHGLSRRDHRLSHRHFIIQPWQIAFSAMPPAGRVECSDNLAWFTPAQWSTLGLPKPVTDVLSEITEPPLC